MKTILSVFSMMTLFFTVAQAAPSSAHTEKDLLGVWKLEQFFVRNAQRQTQEWCEGATGTLAYLPGQMFVSINCASTRPGSAAQNLGGMLFYAGPFEVDRQTNEVIHRVRNFSHPSLNQVFRRKIAMKDADHVSLSGRMSDGAEVVVEFVKQENFSYDSAPLTGVWELVGSENEVPGSSVKIPFCTDYHGLILYTPAGYNAVAINCGEKKDPTVVEPADQFGRKFFYSGKYQVNGKVVTQIPDNASELFLIGSPAVRVMDITGDLLTLDGTNGSKFKATWRKRHSFVGL